MAEPARKRVYPALGIAKFSITRESAIVQLDCMAEFSNPLLIVMQNLFQMTAGAKGETSCSALAGEPASVSAALACRLRVHICRKKACDSAEASTSPVPITFV
jgi:hypothetical protein